MERIEDIEKVKNRFFQVCFSVSPGDERKLTGPEVTKVLRVLNDEAFVKACSLVFVEVANCGLQALDVDLIDQGAIVKASQIQGHARGMTRAYEGLFDRLFEALEKDEE